MTQYQYYHPLIVEGCICRGEIRLRVLGYLDYLGSWSITVLGVGELGWPLSHHSQPNLQQSRKSRLATQWHLTTDEATLTHLRRSAKMPQMAGKANHPFPSPDWGWDWSCSLTLQGPAKCLSTPCKSVSPPSVTDCQTVSHNLSLHFHCIFSGPLSVPGYQGPPPSTYTPGSFRRSDACSGTGTGTGTGTGLHTHAVAHPSVE